MRGFLLVNPRAGSSRPGVERAGRGRPRPRRRDARPRRGDDPAGSRPPSPPRRSGWRAATARSPRSPRPRSSEGSRSSASRSEPGTTSPATPASTPTTRSGRSSPFAAPSAPVDVGRIDGRIFLNNVSLGAYAHLVHRRERHRRRREALARLRALGVALRRPAPLELRVTANFTGAAVVVAANNPYRLDAPLARRPRAAGRRRPRPLPRRAPAALALAGASRRAASTSTRASGGSGRRSTESRPSSDTRSTLRDRAATPASAPARPLAAPPARSRASRRQLVAREPAQLRDVVGRARVSPPTTPPPRPG